MARVRRAAIAALVLIVSLGAVALGATPEPRLTAAVTVPRPLAVVPWPAAPAIVLAEVVTGGASASDEYVELTNRSSTSVDLAGLELVYATSTGTTVTRKASWPGPQPLASGQHLLVANVSGIFAVSADATYSGGLSATGGALVIRPIGGSATDAIAWGDATNVFVEGTAAPAPPAGSSIERRPGGSGGNILDSNDNALDWAVVSAPIAQNLAAPPVPGPGPSPTPTASPTPTPHPDADRSEPDARRRRPSPTPTPTLSPSPTPTPTPSPSPTPNAHAEPTPTPTPHADAEPHAHAEPHADADAHADRDRRGASPAGWADGDGRRRRDGGPRHPRVRAVGLHPGRDRRYRDLPRCGDRGRPEWHPRPAPRHRRRPLRPARPESRDC